MGVTNHGKLFEGLNISRTNVTNVTITWEYYTYNKLKTKLKQDLDISNEEISIQVCYIQFLTKN